MGRDGPTEPGLLSAEPALTLDGSWERGGRSPNSAAIAGLLGIGLVYFYGQSFFLSFAILLSASTRHIASGTDAFLPAMARMMEALKNPVRAALVLSQFLLMLLPTVWIVRRWHTAEVRAYVRFGPCSGAEIALAASAVLLFFPANAFLSDLLVRQLNIPPMLLKANESLFRAASLPEFLVVVAAIAVTPAICEETLFRGYVQRTLERTLGAKSILAAGVVFGLYHLQPLGLLNLSLLGIVFGYFFFASRSLLPGMAAHFTNNAVAALWLYAGESSWLASTGVTGNLAPWLVMVTTPLSALSVYLFARVSRRKRIEREAAPPFLA